MYPRPLSNVESGKSAGGASTRTLLSLAGEATSPEEPAFLPKRFDRDAWQTPW
jgi:hypothetical protein